MSFWTCGPFKDIEDNIELRSYRMIRQNKLQELLKELEQAKSILETGDLEDKLVGSMMKLDVEHRLNILLGIEEDGSEQNIKIPGKAVSELISESTK
tara:strand:+ start:693 stop:983 length:291 start_codon:yes stop_codon:yes gene_type:complete